MGTITCVCEKSFEADIPEAVELSGSTDVYQRLLDGTFLAFTCPHCGHEIRLDAPLRVTDALKGMDIFVVPDHDRNRYLLGLSDYTSGGRIVIGYAELLEKLRIYAENLDDSAVELIKYYLLVKAGAGVTPAIYFHGIENDTLIFDIVGLRNDEVGRIKIGRDIYEKAVNELPDKRQEEPYSTILQPPYVSICKVEIEES
ncbi:MAG: CpXC domain-containing protein [Spirochaetales bacterium]|nr:CpXC domain-containing protein [Spirochaetales bacterium]